MFVMSVSIRCRKCLLTRRTVFVGPHFNRPIHIGRLCYVWEPDPRGGYASRAKKETLLEKWRRSREGFKLIGQELKVLRQEIKEKFLDDPPVVFPGDHEILWRFDNPEMMEKWITVSDKDHSEGYSTCEFILGKHQRAIFKGVLSTELPKTGKINRAGYCNVSCLPPMKSFQRDTYYDWENYTHLLMKIRGDGRSYMINLKTTGYYDVMWLDVYHYLLYTRGGPYWQDVKIPFSKFFLTSKGKIQDKQSPIPLTRISSVGITCSDKVQGPFQLELDYIGVYNDPSHTEKFAYEMYKTPKYIVGV